MESPQDFYQCNKVRKLQNNGYYITLSKKYMLKNLPETENSDRLLTKEKGFLILNLELVVLPLAVHTVILEHIGLQQTGTKY